MASLESRGGIGDCTPLNTRVGQRESQNRERIVEGLSPTKTFEFRYVRDFGGAGYTSPWHEDRDPSDCAGKVKSADQIKDSKIGSTAPNNTVYVSSAGPCGLIV